MVKWVAEHSAELFSLANIGIGIFLLFFYGVYIKRREVGRGMDTPEKRIVVYEAVGIAFAFVAGGLIIWWYVV